MAKPAVITINDKSYYLFDDVYKYDKAYFGNIKRERDIVKLKKLTLNKDYILAYIKGNNWIISNENYSKAKILLDQQWIHTNVPKMMINIDVSNNIDELYDVPPAPELLEIEDHEKFRDSNGNIIEIEIRGERNHKNCYFKVDDISKGFKMPNLQNIIIKENTNYNNNLHYRYFTVEKNDNKINDYKLKKVLFLTFEGLIKTIYNVRYDRIKETNIVNNIKTIFKEYKWICNKRLNCKYRPDIFTIIKDKIIIIEIDEFQHSKYDLKLEEERINAIYNEFNIKNFILIRFNPDKYTDSNNIIHDSIHNNESQWNIRMNTLANIINNSINKTSNNISIIKLFFNKYNNSDNIINFNFDCYDKSIKTKHNIELYKDWLNKKIFLLQLNSSLNTSLDKTPNIYLKEMQERINKLENELKEEQYKHDLTKKDLEYEKKISFEQQQSLLKDIEILNLKLKMAQSNITS